MINFKILFTFLKGLVLGLSVVLPGVSGGTMAFVLGVYHKLINEIGNFTIKDFKFLIPFFNKQKRVKSFKNFIKNYDWFFLIPIGFGALCSALLFALWAPRWIDSYDFEFRALVFGFVTASLYFPLRDMRKNLESFMLLILFFGLSLYIFYTIDSFGALHLILGETSFLLYSITGVITSVALVVPGISGAYILILFGLYSPLLKALGGGHLFMLTFFVLGVIIGFFIMVRIMKFLLQTYFHKIQAMIIGTILGSLVYLWPFFQEEVIFNERGGEFLMYSCSSLVLVFFFGITSGKFKFYLLG